MSDLSNLLGDLYGDADPDGAPVRHEAPASEREEWVGHVDQDLAAALSAALADVPPSSAPVPPVSLAMPSLTTDLDHREVAPPVAHVAPTPAPAAPAAVVPTPVAPATVAAAPAPVSPSNWTSAPEPVAPVTAAPAPMARMWMRGDDDVFPSFGRSSKAKQAKQAKQPKPAKAKRRAK